MPSPEFVIFQSPSRAIQYTGANSADLIAQVPGIEFVSEVDNMFTFRYNGNEQTLFLSHWIIVNAFQVATLNNNQFNTEWGCVAVCDQLNALTSRVEALENP